MTVPVAFTPAQLVVIERWSRACFDMPMPDLSPCSPCPICDELIDHDIAHWVTLDTGEHAPVCPECCDHCAQEASA